MSSVGGAMFSVGATKPEKGSKGEKKTKKEKSKSHERPDPAKGTKETAVADAGCKRRKKLVTRRLSQELLEYIRTKEVLGYMATETPRPSFILVPQDMFDQELKEQIAAEFKENREFDAHVLYQYRTVGYAEIQEEVADDEEEQQVAGDGAMCGVGITSPEKGLKKEKKRRR